MICCSILWLLSYRSQLSLIPLCKCLRACSVLNCIHIYTHTHTYTHTHIRIHPHTHIRAHTHTLTHTQTCTQRQAFTVNQSGSVWFLESGSVSGASGSVWERPAASRERLRLKSFWVLLEAFESVRERWATSGSVSEACTFAIVRHCHQIDARLGPNCLRQLF